MILPPEPIVKVPVIDKEFIDIDPPPSVPLGALSTPDELMDQEPALRLLEPIVIPPITPEVALR